MTRGHGATAASRTGGLELSTAAAMLEAAQCAVPAAAGARRNIATPGAIVSVFRTSRVLSATVTAVFDAIRDPQRLARWWGPDGFTNEFDVFEFAPGGRWQFTMVGPDGKRYRNESAFADIVPGARVRIDHISPPRFVLTIALTPAGSGTHLSWEQAFEDPAVAASVRRIVEPANEQNLDRLAAELRTGGEGGGEGGGEAGA